MGICPYKFEMQGADRVLRKIGNVFPAILKM